MTRDLSCREFIEFVWRYLSGEVSHEERREFEYHLAQCVSCVAYMKTYQETIALSRMAFLDELDDVPEEVPDELVAAVLAARRPHDSAPS